MRARSATADRQVEERLAMLLRPGPRHARLDLDERRQRRSNESHPSSAEAEEAPPEDEWTEERSAQVSDPAGGDEMAERSASDGVRPSDAAVSRPKLGLLGGRFERPQLMVIAVMVVIGLALSGWAVLRARPVELAGDPAVANTSGSSRSATAAAEPSTPIESPGSPAASPTIAMIKVHVLGAVRQSGVHQLPAEARIEDALEAAGGLTRAGALGDLNLAQPLADGQQIFIARNGDRTEVREPGADSGAADMSRGPPGGSPEAQVVNLNTATPEELDQLPGVGPVTAGKILSWREANGRFSSVDELQEVDGIGPKTFAELSPLVTV